ncbi:MAG: tetratricopeptide repeat protein, partial [Candidatus Omnitrophica bacterium]|nr:tetratricopeptide repeat protein [Candidatus Omnitrophota bacterium]
IEYFEKALNVNPNFVDNYINLGELYKMKGDFEGVRKQIFELRELGRSDLADRLEDYFNK